MTEIQNSKQMEKPRGKKRGRNVLFIEFCNFGIVIWDLKTVSLNANRFYPTHAELPFKG